MHNDTIDRQQTAETPVKDGEIDLFAEELQEQIDLASPQFCSAGSFATGGSFSCAGSCASSLSTGSSFSSAC
jgi:hypothetical protein